MPRPVGGDRSHGATFFTTCVLDWILYTSPASPSSAMLPSSPPVQSPTIDMRFKKYSETLAFPLAVIL